MRIAFLKFDVEVLRGRVSTQAGLKISSIFNLKWSEILKAKGKLGSYFPFSIEFIVWRETPKISPISACETESADLSSRSLFFIYTFLLQQE